MTTGEILKKTLGLEFHNTVFISRLLLPSTQRINVVYFKSSTYKLPFPRRECQSIPLTSMIYSGDYLNKNNFKIPTQTPLVDIKEWNGIISNYLFLLVDVSYNKLLKTSNFKELPESIQNKILFPVYIGKINEFLTFSALKHKDNISNLTKSFRKQRNELMGTENRLAKLIDVDINKQENYVQFYFLTEATVKAYPPEHKFFNVDPNNQFAMKQDISKTYTIMLRVLNFFDWLSTHPNLKEITIKEIKEILEISNVKIFSDAPSFHWQGINWNLSQLDASIYPTDIAPKFWNKPNLHGDNAFLDKHTSGLLRSIDFFLNPMASMLTKKLKDRNLLEV